MPLSELASCVRGWSSVRKVRILCTFCRCSEVKKAEFCLDILVLFSLLAKSVPV